MNSTQLRPAHRSALVTLKLGENCYGVTAIEHAHELTFEPLPAGVPQPESVCGLIRLGDGSAVPVFDLRTSGGKCGPYRLLIASSNHGEALPVSLALLVDATPATPHPRRRPPSGATALPFDRN